MSDTRFTPGPWEVICSDVLSNYARPGIDSKLETLVVFGCEDDDEGIHGKSSQESHANAQLMATAPELYDQLRDCIEFIAFEFGKNHPAVIDGYKLLAKARGE